MVSSKAKSRLWDTSLANLRPLSVRIFRARADLTAVWRDTSSPSITSIAPLGKIDTNSAESQALQKKSHHESSGVAPDLIVSAGNSIRLETLSWIGRIQQKYGVKSS
jgi:hypothetical protein